jgi:hypothetical protein
MEFQMSFDFTNVKATVAKPAEIPAITRTRKLAENPFAGHFAKSMAKEDAEGKGQWLAVPELPIVEASEKANLGTVVAAATRHIRNAAANVDKGSEIRTTDNENGTATIHFRSIPRRTRKSKSAE